jgi:predicted amidohydrolase YtcJ
VAVPGLQDAHGHLEELGANLERLDLRGTRSYDEVVERVAARSSNVQPGHWILGFGWDQNDWEEQVFPEHERLSNATPNHPVLLMRIDGHAARANLNALVHAGIGNKLDAAPEVAGGRVHMNGRGFASGVLIDAAIELVSLQIPAPARAERKRHLLAAQAALLADGITCVHDMGVDLTIVDLLEEIRAERALRLRVVAYVWANELAVGEHVAGWGREPGDTTGWLRKPDASGRLAVIGAKLMVDGALGSRGALLLDDYADAPGERGLELMPRADFAARVRKLAEAGLQPATHAIGDRANRMVLDVYEEIMKETPGLRALRPRIEHAQIVALEDGARFRSLGVIPSMQPTHCTSDMAWVPARLGEERSKGAYAWRLLPGTEAPLAFGSDFPVELANPLDGIYAAVTRKDKAGSPEAGFFPVHALTWSEALAGFTSGAAYAVRQEETRGKLLPGYACDVTVIDCGGATLAQLEPQGWLDARVRMTVINGEFVFEN